MDSIVNHPEVLAFIVAMPLFGAIAKIFSVSFKQIAKWYLYVAVFAVVIVMNSIFFPFIGGKDYFFRFAIELALVCYMLWWAFEARAGEALAVLRSWSKKPLFVAVCAFVLIFILACLFALDIHAAFWSNYERGEGGFQILHYFAFFVLSVLLLETEKDWKNIFRFSIVSAGLMAIYGLLGNYSVSGFIGPYTGQTVPTGWWHLLVDGRFQGSLGNPAYVAPYLLFTMFFTLWLWIKGRTAEKRNVWIHVGYAAILFFSLFFFMVSQTRGAFAGLGAAIWAFLVYIAYVRPDWRKLSISILGILTLVFAVLVHYRTSAFVLGLPGGRMFDLPLSDTILLAAGIFSFVAAIVIAYASQMKKLWWVLGAMILVAIGAGAYLKVTNHFPSFADPTTSTRFWVWEEAWKGFVERPVFGWGPENFTAVYDKFFDARFFTPGVATETWFDRAHSLFFDYLAETGLLGVLSYFAMFFITAWEFFSKKRRAMNADGSLTTSEVLERGIIIALPVAYLVQGVAIFDVLPMYINLFLFLAFACYYFYSSSLTNNKHGQHS